MASVGDHWQLQTLLSAAFRGYTASIVITYLLVRKNWKKLIIIIVSADLQFSSRQFLSYMLSLGREGLWQTHTLYTHDNVDNCEGP